MRERILRYREQGCSNEEMIELMRIVDSTLDEINDFRLSVTSPLSEEAEKVHNKAYGLINRISPVHMPKRTVRQGNVGSNGCLYHVKGERLPNIIIGTKVAQMSSETKDFKEFRIKNLIRLPTPKDFLKTTILHEYGHIFRNLDDYSFVRGFEDGEEERAKSEAFAFWFADGISGFRTLYDKLADSYDGVLDVDRMNFLHKRLHKISAKRGIDYVLRNHITIEMAS